MSKIIGYVKSLQNGIFFAKDAQGAIKELKVGDQVFQNELVYGAPSNPQNAQVIIDVTLTDAKDLTLLGSSELYTDLSVIGGSFEKDEAIVSQDAVESAWKLSTGTPNLEGQVDAPAAGLEETAAGQGLSDTERPGGTLFNARTGGIGDVRTLLNQDTLNGGVDIDLAGADTQDLNDQPVVIDVAGTFEEAPGSAFNRIEGQLFASDADVGDTHTFFIVDGSVIINGVPAVGVTVTLSPNGQYVIVGDFNTLAVGQQSNVSFQYYAVDNGLIIGESNTSAPATVTITITGTNDAPVATMEEGFVATEDGAKITGQLVADDIDSDDDTSTLQYSLVGDAPAGFTLNANGSYEFDPSNAAYQDLAQGQTRDVTFAWIATDKHNAITTEQTVTIRVTGTNDAPIAVVDINSVIELGDESLSAYGSKGVATGNLFANDTDVDNGANLDIVSVGGQFVNAFGHIVASGQYGALHVNKETGQYEYILNNSNTQVNGLDTSETLTEKFTYKITDEHGAMAESTLEVTINGTNDAPIISVNTGNWFNLNDTVSEAGLPTGTNASSNSEFAKGTFTIGDVDGLDDIKSIQIGTETFEIDATHSLSSLVGKTVETSHGEVTIASYSDGIFSYTYELTEATTDVRGTETDSFKVVVSDGEKSDSVTVTINIEDDKPIANADIQITNEDAVSISGNVLNNDKVGADGVQSVSFTTTQGTYGTLSYDASSGGYTYTLKANAQTLAQGESFKEVFNYTLKDGDGDTSNNSLAITVTGTNDAPVLTSSEPLAFSVKEDVAIANEPYAGIININALATDIDHNATLHLSQVNGNAISASTGFDTTVTFSYINKNGVSATFDATLHVNQNGTYEIKTDSDLNVLPQGEDATASLILTIADEYGAQTSPKTVEITINGENDKATVSPIFSTATEDAAVFSINLLSASNAQDIDSSSVSYVANSASLTSTTDAGGFSVLSSGIVSVNPSYYNALDVGEKVEVTYTFKVTDGITEVENTATITITGANDAPQIVLNNTYTESFEGIIGNSGWARLRSSSFTGDNGIEWTTTGDNLEIQNNGTLGSINATDGRAYAELDSGRNLSLSTTLNLSNPIATLSFEYRPRTTNYETNEMDVTFGTNSFKIDHTSAGIVIKDVSPGLNVAYTVVNGWYSFNVAGTNLFIGDNTLTFTGTGISDSLGALLDNIAVNHAVVYESGLATGTRASDSSYPTTVSAAFTVSDPDGLDDIKSITVEGTTFTVSSIGNFAAIVGQTISSPTYGDVKIVSYDGSGKFTYTYTLDKAVENGPSSNLGQDKFTISVSDESLSDTATVRISIADDAPIALNDTGITTNEDTVVYIDVLANDKVGADGYASSPISVNDPTNGMAEVVEIAGTWKIKYTPDTNYSGDETITYTLTDKDGDSSTSNVTVTVNPVADAPSLFMSVGLRETVNGINIVRNGSFEDVDGNYGDAVNVLVDNVITSGNLVNRTQIPGWKLDNATMPSMPAMEPHDKGHASVGSTQGDNYMDLGASPGNSAIYQEFTTLATGSVYQFSVDYRDKAAMQEVGQDGKDSGVMQVLWNDKIIGTIYGDNTTSWETLTFAVTARSGTNKLTFKEVGVADDNWGMAIDNVRLQSTSYVYDLHVTAQSTDTNETLGDLIIDGATLPAGAKLYLENNALPLQVLNNLTGDIAKDYVIDVTNGAVKTMTVVTDTPLTVEQMNTISGSVTSTDGTVATTSTTVEHTVATVNEAGVDKLVLPNNDGIDFSILDSTNNPLKSIEVIDLSVNGNHALKNLSLSDVIDITDSNNTLTILGDSGDKVTVDATLTKTGTQAIGGQTFDIYTHTNASDPTVIVKIDQDIQQS